MTDPILVDEPDAPDDADPDLTDDPEPMQADKSETDPEAEVRP